MVQVRVGTYKVFKPYVDIRIYVWVYSCFLTVYYIVRFRYVIICFNDGYLYIFITQKCFSSRTHDT